MLKKDFLEEGKRGKELVEEMGDVISLLLWKAMQKVFSEAPLDQTLRTGAQGLPINWAAGASHWAANHIMESD